MTPQSAIRILGDNIYERRIRLLGGVCMLVTLGALVWYYWTDKRSITDQVHTTGRLLAEQAMLREHWKSLAVKPEVKTLVQDLSTSLSTRNYPWCILSPAENDTPAHRPRDEVDAGMLRSYAAMHPDPSAPDPPGAGQYLPGSKEYRYYQPIWAQQSCLSCHRSGLSSDTLSVPDVDPTRGVLRVGDLLGVVAITMTNEPSRYPLHVNRAMLLWTVVVTLLLISIATACILRWPVAKSSDGSGQ